MNTRPGRRAAVLLTAAGLAGGLVAGVPPAAAAGSPGTITTVAGGPGRGPATAVFQMPQALAAGPGGVLYAGDGTVVRQLSSTRSWESVFAGTGGTGYSGNGTPATGARLTAAGLALDGSGNVLIADSDNARIRVAATATGMFYGRAMTAGDIYTVAGTGQLGYSGDGGPATSAAFLFPRAVAAAGAGNLVIADSGNHRVRVVAGKTGRFYGQAMTAGDVYTVAGTGADGYSGDGGPATSADLGTPQDVTAGPAGNLLIADPGDNVVRVVAGKTGRFYGQAMTAGDIYTVAGTGQLGYSGDGGPGRSAKLDYPTGVTLDPAGNIVIADFGNNRVRVVAARTGTFYGRAMAAGDIYTVAGTGTSGYSGTGGPATAAELSSPEVVRFDAAGNLVIADDGNDRLRVVAGKTGTFYGQAMTAGDIYTVAGNGTLGFSGSGGKATNAELYRNIKFAANANVAADGANYVAVSSQQAWFICNTAGTYFGRAMTAGDIYVVAGDGFKGYRGDGGPGPAARLGNPAGIAVDGAGNLVIADSGNNRVRVLAAATGTFYGQAMTVAHIYTVAGTGTAGDTGDGGPASAAELSQPQALTVDPAGNLVIGDTGNNRVRVVAAKTGTFYGRAMTGGDIYTVAGTGTAGYAGDGGPASAAELRAPQGVAVDAAGGLVIGDTGNNRVRVVAAKTGTFYGRAMTAGDIYTVAGDGHNGFAGDGGPATAAELSQPPGVAVDGAGNLIIADLGNNRVRVAAARTGTFYGVAMTAGDIYTVAGDSALGGYSGDGGPATAAALSEPQGVAVDGAGDLVIADSRNGRVRVVSG